MATLNRAPTTDFTSTTLNGNIDNAVLTITVNNASNIQTPTYAVIDRLDTNGTLTPNSREVVYISSKATNDLTVTRGVNNSTARSHNSGAILEPILSVGMYSDLYDVVTTSHDTSGNIAVTGNASIAAVYGRSMALASVATIRQLYTTNYANFSGASVVGIYPSGASGGVLTSNGNSAFPVYAAPYALRVKIGTMQLPTTVTGSKAVTGVGFTPKVVQFILRYTNGTGFYISSNGFMDGTSQFCHCIADAGGTTNAVTNTTSACILATTSGGVTRRSAAFTSFDADGFTIDVTDATGSDDYQNWSYIAMG